MADLAQAVAWHRQVAALAAAADRAGVATAELPAVRARLLPSRAASPRSGPDGAAAAGLVPTPIEIAAAGPALGDLSEPAVAADRTDDAAPHWTPLTPRWACPRRHRRRGRWHCGLAVPGVTAAADATGRAGRASGQHADPGTEPAQGISRPHADRTVSERPSEASPLRNATVYGAFAATVLLVQIGLFIVLDESARCHSRPRVPAGAAGLRLARRLPDDRRRVPAGARRRRRSSARPGWARSSALVPDLLLCAGVGVLFVVKNCV